MKSVKNFFIERINSIDHSDNSSTGSAEGGGGSKKKHQLSKLKCGSGGNGSGSLTANTNNDGVTPDTGDTPTFIPYTSGGGGSSGGDDVSPSTASLYAQTPNVETPMSSSTGDANSAQIDEARSPISCDNDGNGNSSPTKSPFIFPTTADTTDDDEKNSSVIATATPHVSTSLSTPTIKPQKSRRKISLPWFRQSSVTHVGLSRQYTIDSPGSFRLFRQPSNFLKVGAQETTWVVSDYIATAGSNELSVTKGQQVEVIEAPSATEPDFCLVRLNPQNDDAAVQEGLVPVSILKPPPGSQKSSSASRKDNNDSIQEQTNNRVKPDPLTSSTKRRGFSGPKWFPLRKHSTSKGEKSPAEKSLIKKPSEKSLRIPQKHSEHEEKNLTTATSSSSHTHSTKYSTSTHSSSVAGSATSQHNTSQQDYEAEEEAGLELPPPMKPIQEPHLMANGPQQYNTKDLKENSANMANTGKMDGNTAIDLSEIEQIVKEKTEQHEEKSKFLNNSNACDSNGRGSGGSSGIGVSELDYASDNNDENNAKSKANDIEEAKRKRMHALSELIQTEELYIQDLSEIVNRYIAEVRNPNSDIPIPEDLKGAKERMVFGNIEAIYEWHRDYFLDALRRCQKTPADLGNAIKRYEHKFQMYNVYCQNKPVSEHIVNTHSAYFDQIRIMLKHRLDLNDLLIKPVQRITKYQLLFSQIKKHTEKAGLFEEVASMEESFRVMKVACKAANDMMELRRLQKFDGKITAQGKLLLYGPLACIEDAKNAERNAYMVQKPRELQVFLFEQSIIFADIDGKKQQFTSPTFTYRSHIQVNKMQLEELPNNRFLLKSIDPNRPDLHMICYAATVDLNQEWLKTIRNILQSQHDFLKAITSPIQYQKDLTKET